MEERAGSGRGGGAGWRQARWRSRLAAARGGGARTGGSRLGRDRRETRGRVARDLIRVKFDGVYVAYEFKLRTWVPTFLI